MILHLSEALENIQKEKPLVHHITNYVTVTDCANITLAIGASPVMADDIGEAAEITSISSALVINMGTLNARTVESMIASGKMANEKGIPVVFDPVGAGASHLRNETAAKLLKEVHMTVIRGNVSEIRCIAGLSSHTKGVDAADSGDDAEQVASGLAEQLKCIVAVTGAVDTISDGTHTLRIRNGHPALSGITGTGCMCTSLIASFCGGNPKEPMLSAAAGIICMGIAGEIAWEKAGTSGNGSFHAALLDAVSLMDGKTLQRLAKYDEK